MWLTNIWCIDCLPVRARDGRVVAGRPAQVLGVDVIDHIEAPQEIAVFFTHALFHRYHFEVAGFSDNPGDRQAIWRTFWAEGLATYVSAQMKPDHPLADARIYPRDLADLVAPQVGCLAGALLDNYGLTPKLSAAYFETSDPPHRKREYHRAKVTTLATG